MTKNWVKFLYGAFILTFSILIAPKKSAARETLKAGRHSLSIRACGFVWRYHAQVPSGYDGRKAIPLVLIFHGAGGSGEAYLDKNGWAAKAEKECFAAVAPDGLPAWPNIPAQFLLNPRLWNDGQLRPDSQRSKIDDVAFVRALLDDLEHRLNIDAARIYVTGHSNGAGMTFRLGTELSEKFAAIAPVSGHCWLPDPHPEFPRPTLFMVGTKDPLVRVEGGEIVTPWGKKINPTVDRTLQKWAKALGISTDPHVIRDQGGIKILRYGRENAPVSLTAWFIEGQGHGWPGGRESGLPARWIGPAVDTVNATDTVWEFFKNRIRQQR